jgi:anti-anti-sigma factor
VVERDEDPLTVETEVDGDRATVVLRGELDIATRRPVFDTLVALVADGVTDLVIDAAGLTFLDSSGLGLLLEVRRMGVSLTLRNPSPWVRRVLDLVMIDGLIGIEDV